MAARRVLYLLPVLLFGAIAAWFAVPLMKRTDPTLVPSVMIDRPVPAFDLPALPGQAQGLASTDLKGGVHVVNFFASWCVPCRSEHAELMKATKLQGIDLVGIAYKDQPQDVAGWLASYGDPYRRIGVDADGRTAIDWGVYGVPETYVVDAAGRIRYRHVGPLSAADVEQTLLPLIRSLGR